MLLMVLAMISILDEGIGRVIEKLHEKSMLDNSIIVFFSDNGAPSKGFLSTTGSNYPLRGVNKLYFKFVKNSTYIFYLAKKHTI